MAMSIYTAAILLLLVMDPLGNVPVFLSILKHVPPSKRRKVILREAFIAYGILLIFLFFGQHLLDSMQLSDAALSIAGGVILFIIAIRMIFPGNEKNTFSTDKDPLIVPLAVPMIAGPSSMAIVMLMASQSSGHLLTCFFALSIAWAITATVLYCGESLRKVLGERGLASSERLMGMILTTLSIQMLLNGISKFFKLT
jgi:multiple antibiotic resistance protein